MISHFDSIFIKGAIDFLTMRDLCFYLSSNYKVRVKTVAWKDFTLYADYFTDAEERLNMSIKNNILALFTNNDATEVEEIDNKENQEGSSKFIDDRDNSSDELEKLYTSYKIARERGFIDLEVYIS